MHGVGIGSAGIGPSNAGAVVRRYWKRAGLGSTSNRDPKIMVTMRKTEGDEQLVRMKRISLVRMNSISSQIYPYRASN